MKSKRILDLGTITTQIAVKELENLTSQLFLSKEKREKQTIATQQQIAEIIFSKLSQLKGAGLKLLQVMSLDEELLPKPYIEKFESAYGSIPPLSRPVVKKIFKNELLCSPEDVFKEFNYTPLAAASLGQVHEALLESGEKVVVKIQYPNVAENMKTDLKFIKAIAGATANSLIKNSIEELTNSLLAETNYTIEAQNISLFQKLEKPKKIIIPHTFNKLSTQRVLTLSKIEGAPLNQITSQDLKNVALQDIFDFFFLSLTRSHCIHSDPHPGNFIICKTHTGIVDFGSVKKDIPKNVVELFMLLLTKNTAKKRIVDLYEQLGANISTNTDQFFSDHVSSYHNLCLDLFNSSQIDFSSKRNVVSQMRKTLFFQSNKPDLQGLSPEFTLLHKAFQSLLFMLCKYQAQIYLRDSFLMSAK